MSDDYRPPSARLAEPQKPRHLLVSVLAGVFGAAAAWVAMSIVVAVALAPDPFAVEAEAEVRDRIVRTGYYETTVALTWLIGAIAGGWTAARVGRGRWIASSLMVAVAITSIGVAAAFARFGYVSGMQAFCFALVVPGSLAGGYFARAS